MREALARHLPDSMIPTAFVALDVFPLSVNGKLDRRTLPAPDMIDVGRTYRAPRDRREALLCQLFAELTGAVTVGIDDNFFAIGGHSLLALRLIGRLRQQQGLELPVRAVFDHPTPEALARDLEQAARHATAPIVAGAGQRDGGVVLSFGQERFWAIDRLDAHSIAYNIVLAFHLTGPIDADALARAVSDLLTRHTPLRTVIEERNGLPRGRLLPPPDADQLLILEDLSAVAPEANAELLNNRLRAEAARPFDLSTDPLLRVRLFRLGMDAHALTILVHHSATDGSSMPILMRDLATAYAARLSGSPPMFASFAVTYADYAAWLRQRLEESGDLVRHRAHWRDRLTGVPVHLTLPTDRPARPESCTRGGLSAGGAGNLTWYAGWRPWRWANIRRSSACCWRRSRRCWADWLGRRMWLSAL